jgi:flagellar export protein FliJ
MSRGKPGTLERLLRVRRLTEEMSRAEVAQRRRVQAQMESRMSESQAAMGIARQQAWEVLASGVDGSGRWRLHCEDSELSREQSEQWRQRARMAGEAASEAEALYLDDRRRRRQVETLLEEKAALAALEESRREQRQFDEWFSMRRGAALPRREREKAKNGALPGDPASVSIAPET